MFSEAGRRLGGFSLPGRCGARVTLGNNVLSGVGSLQYTGRVDPHEPARDRARSSPSSAWRGTPTRSIGALRPTGHEAEPDLHLALNSGLPLANPAAGSTSSSRRASRRSGSTTGEGRLVFERHIEGVELDRRRRRIPTVWPRRPGGGRQPDLPLVTPMVRTAAVDPAGNLWVVAGAAATRTSTTATARGRASCSSARRASSRRPACSSRPPGGCS